MKNYNEMAKSALNRINEYEVKKKRQNKIIACTVTVEICVFLVIAIGIGAWQSGILNKKIDISEEATNDEIQYYEEIDNGSNEDDKDGYFWYTDEEDNNKSSNKFESSKVNGSSQLKSESTTEATDDICDMLGTLVYKDVNYVQVADVNVSKLQIGKLLGKASDFEGFYKNKEIDGKVYTVKGHSNLIIVHLENGSKVVLKAVE